MKKIISYGVIIIGGVLIALSLFLKCYMFGFSNSTNTEHITIYAYTFSEKRTKEAVDEYFSDDLFILAKEKAENLEAKDINALYTKVYLSGLDYVGNESRSFIDRFYSLFLLSFGAIIVIIGINLLSERREEY